MKVVYVTSDQAEYRPPFPVKPPTGRTVEECREDFHFGDPLDTSEDDAYWRREEGESG